MCMSVCKCGGQRTAWGESVVSLRAPDAGQVLLPAKPSPQLIHRFLLFLKFLFFMYTGILLTFIFMYHIYATIHQFPKEL